MRVPITPEGLVSPPPPYTPSASDITPTSPPFVAGEPLELPIRTIAPETAEDDAKAGSIVSSQVLSSSNVTSAIYYFTNRPFQRGEVLQNEGVVLHHLTKTIHLGPSMVMGDICFPDPAETFFNRDITYKDWNVFQSHLFPIKTSNDNATDSSTLSQQPRMEAVIAEWNKGFFNPRRIDFNLSAAPPSPSNSKPVNQDTLADCHHRRSASMSSASSITSSNVTDSSILSADIESVPPSEARDLLTSFRETLSRTSQLRSAFKDFRANFQAQANSLTPEERKALRKCYKKEHRELKNEIRNIVKDAVKETKSERKTLRKAAQAERKEARKARKQNYHKRVQEKGGNRHGPNSRVERQPSNGQGRSQNFGSNSDEMHVQAGNLPRSQTMPGQFPSFEGNVPTWGATRSASYVGGTAQSLGSWVKAAEDACKLAEQHLDAFTKRIDGALEEGERRLERGLRGV